jgi:hypothetical protein
VVPAAWVLALLTAVLPSTLNDTATPVANKAAAL